MSAPEVRLPDGLVAAQLLGGAGVDDAARLEDVGAAGEGQREVGVLLDEEHGGAGLADQFGDPVEHLAGDQGSETQRRFVEQHQAGPAHEGAGDGQHLLFATAHGSGVLGLAFAQPGEDVVPALDVGLDIAAAAGVGADSQIFVDGEVGDGAAALGHVGDAGLEELLGAGPLYLLAVEADGAAAIYNITPIKVKKYNGYLVNYNILTSQNVYFKSYEYFIKDKDKFFRFSFFVRSENFKDNMTSIFKIIVETLRSN